MKVMSKSVLVMAAAATAACVAEGGPSDYKKTVQRRVAPAKVESRIPGRTLVDFGKMAFGFLELVPPAGARGPYDLRLRQMEGKRLRRATSPLQRGVLFPGHGLRTPV